MEARYDTQASGFGGGGLGVGGPGFGGFGGGIGGFGLFGLIGLLGRRGLGGDDCDGGGRHGDDCHRAIWEATMLSKLGNVEAAIPASTAAINEVTNSVGFGLTANLGQLALGLKDSFSQQLITTLGVGNNLKDSIQIGIAAQAAQNNDTQALIAATTCAIKTAIAADGDLTRGLINQIDRDRLRDELDQVRHAHRTAENNITMSTVVNQSSNQMQQQQQQQQQQQAIFDLSHRFACFNDRFNVLQNMIQTNRSQSNPVNFGGVQANTPNQSSQQVGGQGF
jgi:hypothetical protein